MAGPAPLRGASKLPLDPHGQRLATEPRAGRFRLSLYPFIQTAFSPVNTHGVEAPSTLDRMVPERDRRWISLISGDSSGNCLTHIATVLQH